MSAAPLPTHETEFHAQLPDYASMDEAAEILGRTTARIRQMVANNNFRTVYRLGSRPTYFFDRAELRELADTNEAAA